MIATSLTTFDPSKYHKVVTKQPVLLFLLSAAFFIFPTELKSPTLVRVQQGLKFGPQFFDPARNLFEQNHLEEENWGHETKTEIDLNQVVGKAYQENIEMKVVEAPALVIHRDPVFSEGLTGDQKRRLARAEIRSEDFGESVEAVAQLPFPQQSLLEAAQQIDPRVSISENWVQGSLRLQGGVALGDQRVLISRIYKNQVHEVGDFDPKKNKFKIKIQEPLGEIKVEILSAEGEVIAEGSRPIDIGQSSDVTTVLVSPPSAVKANVYNFVKNPDLGKKQNPKNYINTASTVLPDIGRSVPVSAPEIPRISKSSVVRTVASENSIAPSNQIQTMNQDLNIPGFKLSFVESLRKALDIDESDQNWMLGQVLLDDQPIEGAEIRLTPISTATDLGVSHYFQNWFPDNNKTKTGTDGVFLISGLSAGFFKAQAFKNKMLIGTTLVEIQTGRIASLVIKTSLKKSVSKVQVYDAFLMNPAIAQVQMTSLLQPFETSGYQDLTFSSGPESAPWGIAELTPKDLRYARASYNYTEGDAQIFLPLIQKQWLFQFNQPSSELAAEPVQLVGFVPDQDFEVFLPPEIRSDKIQIFYFDATGVLVPRGLAGGGFVINHLPADLVSVSVISGMGKISTQLVWTSHSTPSVAKFLF